MAQHDYVVANDSGAGVRADINNALAAIVSINSGASAPSTTYAHMLWADTTNGVLKRRNAANSGWLVVRSLDEATVLSRSSNTLLDVSDMGEVIRATGSYTQTFDAVATLGDGWWVGFRVESGATLTFDPNSTETIDGATTLAIVGPASGFVYCNGSALYTVGLGVAAGAAQTFLGANVALNNTANYFDIVNSGSVGAAGQVWLITANATFTDGAGSASCLVRIWDGTTTYKEVEVTVPNINYLTQATISALVTLSGPTTFYLSMKDRSSTNGNVLTTGNSGTPNKATDILALRLK